MSSKRAMKQAQKQAYAKHRSNITNSRFEKKNKKFQMLNLKKYIDNWDEDKNLVLITHYVVISEVLNYAPSSGEIVVSDKNFEIIGNIEIDY